MRFEDLNTYNARSVCFAVCNENIATWREILVNVEVDNAASICSGGEVSFFGILPRVKEKLDLIDHSYQSMFYAIGKYHAVETLGAEKAHELFRDRNALYWDAYYRDRPMPELMRLFKEANENLPTQKDAQAYYDCYGLPAIFDNDVTKEDVGKFREAREKITFMHGDLNDLIERGPYDLVYLSNALQYKGRNGDAFEIEKYVKPGGYIALTYGSGGKPPAQISAWEVVEKRNITTYRDQDTLKYGLPWNYLLCKAPA